MRKQPYNIIYIQQISCKFSYIYKDGRVGKDWGGDMGGSKVESPIGTKRDNWKCLLSTC